MFAVRSCTISAIALVRQLAFAKSANSEISALALRTAPNEYLVPVKGQGGITLRVRINEAYLLSGALR
jgi:hypothetical protein